MGFGLFEFIFPVFFITVFTFVIGTFVFVAAKGISEWNRNNRSPRLTVNAKVVAKRAHTSRHHHNHNGHMHTSHSTSYHVTFEFESGDRLELCLPASEYALLIEGDTGSLSFQGTRYLSFVRKY